jgi:hypothetical protein
VVALGAEAHARLDDVVGLGTALDLSGHVGQSGVHPVTLGTSLDPTLLVVGENDVGRTVTVAHRCPLSKESTRW